MKPENLLACAILVRWFSDLSESDPAEVCDLIAPFATDLQTDSFFAYKGMWVFRFGAYGDTSVFACGALDEALEDAAALLPASHFVELDLDSARDELTEGGEENPTDDEILERAETDLTHTESGYMPSWEWMCDEVTLQDLARLAMPRRQCRR